MTDKLKEALIKDKALFESKLIKEADEKADSIRQILSMVKSAGIEVDEDDDGYSWKGSLKSVPGLVSFLKRNLLKKEEERSTDGKEWTVWLKDGGYLVYGPRSPGQPTEVYLANTKHNLPLDWADQEEKEKSAAVEKEAASKAIPHKDLYLHWIPTKDIKLPPPRNPHFSNDTKKREQVSDYYETTIEDQLQSIIEKIPELSIKLDISLGFKIRFTGSFLKDPNKLLTYLKKFKGKFVITTDINPPYQ